MKKRLSAPAAFVLSLLLSCSLSAQNAGELDNAFDGDGKAIVALGQGSLIGYSTLVQPDGKILVYGENQDMVNFETFLLRLLPDGSPDPAFGTGGMAVLRGPTESFWTSGGLALQSDGKILGVGRYLGGSPFVEKAAVYRWTADGQLDPAFGSGGRALIDLGGGPEFFDVAVTADSRILAAGESFQAPSFTSVVVRLLPNGTPDPAFGTDGVARLDLSTGTDWFNAVVPLPDGRMVAVGYARLGTPALSTAVAVRLLANGSPDPAFGNQGIVDFVTPSVSSYFYDAALQPDGKIVMAGRRTLSGNGDLFLARLLADGSPDPNFGSGGQVFTDAGGNNETFYALALQSDGGIVGVGYQFNSATPVWTYQSELLRYTEKGLPDTTFGVFGVVDNALTPFGPLFGVALQSDGKIVGAGQVRGAGPFDVAVTRYDADGAPDTNFGNAGLARRNVSWGVDWSSAVLALPYKGVFLASSGFLNEMDMVLTHFSDQGTVQSTIILPGTPGGGETAYAMAATPDGKIALAGYTADSVWVWRLLDEGQPDQSFGQQGRARLAMPNQTNLDVAVQGDGKILVAGNLTGNTAATNAAVFRLKTDGTPDPGWGQAGLVLAATDFTQARALALQQDGGVLVAGSVLENNQSHQWLTRFLPNGLPDAAFGEVVLPIASVDETATDVAVDNAGRLLLAGIAQQVNTNMAILLNRRLANGLPDTDFGVNGTLSFPINSTGTITAKVAVQPDGKILLASTKPGAANNDIFLTRRLADGSPDAGFGTNGEVTVGVFGYDNLTTDLTIAPDGKIYLSATAFNGADDDAVVLRLLSGLVIRAEDLSLSNGTLLIYPNPISDRTTLRYDNPKAGQVSIFLENLEGARLRTFFNGWQAKGEQSVELDLGGDLPAGTYVCRVKTGGGEVAVRVVKG